MVSPRRGEQPEKKRDGRAAVLEDPIPGLPANLEKLTKRQLINWLHAEHGRVIEVKRAFTLHQQRTQAIQQENTSRGSGLKKAQERVRKLTADLLAAGHKINAANCELAKQGQDLRDMTVRAEDAEKNVDARDAWLRGRDAIIANLEREAADVNAKLDTAFADNQDLSVEIEQAHLDQGRAQGRLDAIADMASDLSTLPNLPVASVMAIKAATGVRS